MLYSIITKVIFRMSGILNLNNILIWSFEPHINGVKTGVAWTHLNQLKAGLNQAKLQTDKTLTRSYGFTIFSQNYWFECFFKKKLSPNMIKFWFEHVISEHGTPIYEKKLLNLGHDPWQDGCLVKICKTTLPTETIQYIHFFFLQLYNIL